MDDRQGPLIERLLRDGGLRKTTALYELAESKHHYALLASLKSRLIVREHDGYVTLCQPEAVRDVLESLDDYVAAVGGAADREARERKQRRLVDDEASRRRMRAMAASRMRVVDRRSWFHEDFPKVHWISYHGGSRAQGELLGAAARYDEPFDLVTINADWRGYLELRDEVGRSIADPSLVELEEAWRIADDEWRWAIVGTVVALRKIAYEEELTERLPEYLSEHALTAAVADRSYIYATCRSKIQKLESGRRHAAKPARADKHAAGA
jgi:hypothetical protein